MNKPKVLVGITTKNRADILPKSINSAINQSYENKEIWVYDDCSIDETSKLSQLYPIVKWTTGSESMGLVFARNYFMNNLNFDYFCSLDDDAWFLDEGAIEKAIEILEKDKLIGALGFDMLTPDNNHPKSDLPIPLISNNFVGCGHIINLKAARKVGFYILNPGFYGCEEKDLCIRLIDKNFKIILFKNMYVWHDKTNISRDLPKQHRSGVCNDLVFTWRRAPFVYLFPSLIVKLWKHFKFAITYNQQPLLKAFLLGIFDFTKWLITKKKFRVAVSNIGFKRYINLK